MESLGSFSPALLVRVPVLGMFLLLAGVHLGHGAPGQGPFPAPYNTRNEQPILKPEESAKSIQMPPGFQVTLFAGEPDVQQPIGMSMDRKGRLWVCENYTYSQQPAGWDTNLSDRVVVLEDRDGDGRFNSRTVFWDRAKKLTSVAVGFGGVFALCPPQLLFIPDRNGDAAPDGEPQVLLDGFEDTVVWHNIANGLKFGPDGWLYGRQGIQGTSRVGAPGTPPEKRVAFNAGIWRFHPITHRCEVVAEGTTNPWGTDWDDHGQLFFINTVIGHLWHVVPGAYYRRMYGTHLRSHLYEWIDQTADHFHWDTRDSWDRIRVEGVTATTDEAGGGHAHSGLMVYLGDNWPEQYRNTVFAINFHGKRLNNDFLKREGATYTATHGPDLMQVGDTWFRGIDLLYGPDGGVFVSDWSDIGECHNAEAINRTSGRIYKITYGSIQPPRLPDFAALSGSELVRMQTHHNDWFLRQARLTLHERAASGADMRSVHRELRRLFARESATGKRLRALWALYVTGGTDEDWLRALLHAEDEQMRVWGIQLLVDQQAPSTAVLAEFQKLAVNDSSGLVLTWLASALRRVPLESRLALATSLASREAFAEDKVFPLMLWYGLEPAVAAFPDRAVKFAESSKMSKLRRFVARRLLEELKANPAAADQVVALLKAPRAESFQTDILRGISEALQTVQQPAAPASWAEASSVVAGSANPLVRELGLEIGALFGDLRALERLRGILADEQADPGTRRKALKTLLQSRAEKLSGLLFPLLKQVQIAPDAVRALAGINEPEVTKTLLERYPHLEPQEAKGEAINALASRPLSALALLDAVQHGLIPKRDMGPTQLRQLRSLDHPEVDAKLNAIWPQLDESPSGKKELFARYKELLAPAQLKAANAFQGRQVYQQVCGLCHTLYGEGAKIGPELTGSDRQNLDYLLDNILDPSGVVADNYRMWTVTMKDDRVLNGIVLARDDEQITLQTVSERAVLPRSEILTMSESRVSMMPEGLLQGLKDEQARDLVAYLMSPGQVPLPASEPAK
jgi:putative membrane-bound dehydrogenase-like protein